MRMPLKVGDLALKPTYLQNKIREMRILFSICKKLGGKSLENNGPNFATLNSRNWRSI